MKTKLLIFGITGDLSTRKLLPSLQAIIKTGQFDDLQIIGASRRHVDVSDLLNSSLGNDALVERVSIVTMDMANRGDYDTLKSSLALADDDQLLVYLSVPPTASTQIVDFLGEAGLNTPNVKILFEKPFGVDLASAEEAIGRTSRYFAEEQIYRIDHYLAKEMAQNIVAFRGGNAIFSHLWHNEYIESIEITASETIGIEGRGQFYEQTGALRDVIQGHLLQLLALTLMHVPDDFDWNDLPRLRLEALEKLKTVDPHDVVRGQYDGYKEEVQNPRSLTETFVSLQLESSSARWEGVPITLTTGKALDTKTTEIRINLRKRHDAQSNQIVFRIQPNEGIEIDLFVKKPGFERDFESRTLGFTYPEDTTLPDAYEHVLVDAIRSRKSLFASGEEVLCAWRILSPVQQNWEMNDKPLEIYQKGSSPSEILS